MTEPCHVCSNSQCLVKHCSEEWVERITARKNLIRYPKGQYVFMEGSHVLGAYFLLSGKVKVVSSNKFGKEQTVRLATDGHMLGHTAIGLEWYSIGAVTLDKSRICFVDNQTLKDAFMENPKFTFEVMRFYSRELRKSEIRTKCLAQMNNEEKVILGLLYLAEIYAVEGEMHDVEINLSRQEIAQVIGTNPEQVSRVLTNLKEEGLIQTKRRNILIPDIERLKKSIGGYTYATEY